MRVVIEDVLHSSLLTHKGLMVFGDEKIVL
jgi:hypothetical protein